MLTGERVLVDHGVVRAVETAPAAGKDPVRIHSMAVGEHFYVVPDKALPFVGRQLDLALFDVLAPPAALQVEWAAGATPHDIPGLDLATGRLTDPAAFGAGAAGVKEIRPVGAAEPTADPQYPIATLTVRGLDKLGAKAISGGVSITNAEDVQRFSSLQSFVDGQVSFSVPVGHYSLEVSITTYDADGVYQGDALLFYPELAVTGTEMTVTADAATATTVVPVPATPNPSGLEQMQATYSRLSAAGNDSTTAIMMIGGSPSLSVTPTDPVALGDVRWYTYFRLTSPADAYLYDLVFPADGAVPADFAEKVPASGLATLDATYAAEGDTSRISTYRTSFQPWEQFPIRFASTAVAPLRRTEYVSAVPGVGWIGSAVARPDEFNGSAQSPMVEYRPGQRTTDRYFAAPGVPGVDRTTLRSLPCPACRQSDQLLLDLQPRTDAGGHAVRLTTSETAKIKTEFRVYADEALAADGTDPVGRIAIPADATQLRLELDSSASASWLTTADRVQTAWSWRTTPPGGSLPAGRTCADPCAFLPLVFADYGIAVDTANAVPAGVATPLSVTLRRQAFDPTPVTEHLTLDVSADDGATWRPLPVASAGGGRFTATVTPAAGYLSLRIHATDPAGATLDQTVIRAVRVAA
ncbi:hypothetical protein Adu01nite_69540 [Paractinoplanes durhamensis]|uniref:Serine protease n=1 Tax=Paractinoplanes durhamensis TaxID=113563 RepID=A0ABQ3Z700_9ACTN|nr:hypothetical protein Adu01nite_69540 [Actinoplanes durhamensis]